ncbi:MAG: ATPase, T2SS/T4P/T4SS family [Candidatus Hydrogenedentota bacterium]
MIHRERFDPRVLTSWPKEFLLTYAIAPLRDEDGKVIVFGSSDARAAAMEIGMLLDRDVSFVEAEAKDVRRFVMEKYDTGSGRQDAIEELERDGADVRELEELANDAPVVRLVGSFLQKAAEKRASDVHIEPYEDESVIRFRIDGVLSEQDRLPRGLHPGVVSRIKILGRLDIAQTRLPQDGRIALAMGGREIDLRVSTIPTPLGERVVLRLLDRSSVRYGMTDLGLDGETLTRWQELLGQPHGIILVTGPTGSGKTTSLYAALETLKSGRVNILTVEDPVEYQLQGIGQVQVNPRINLTFASGLRSLLRQDPDIIMVGEIRDSETAVIAVQAALTGHLVLSTLHTNDAASAPPRLQDMGIESYLLSSTMRGVMGQRLVRKLCMNCRQPVQVDRSDARALDLPEDTHVYRAAGCETCEGVGFKGRLGLFELMLVDDDVKDMILARRASGEILRAARKKGMKTIKEDGRDKVLRGLTTPSEIIRVTDASAGEEKSSP